MPIHPLRWSFAFAAALLLACSSPTGMCACPPARGHAVIYGTVRTAADQPVEGATVRAAVFRSVCGQGTSYTNPDANSAQTDAAGAYRLHFYSLSGGTSCVRVTARSPGGADSTYVDVALELRHEDAEPDSARVDLVLP